VASKPPEQKTYTVVKGDNPFRIAKRFGVHYKELLSHNGITDPSKLQIGQTLRIPN
jgi:LysM repeat protein